MKLDLNKLDSTLLSCLCRNGVIQVSLLIKQFKEELTLDQRKALASQLVFYANVGQSIDKGEDYTSMELPDGYQDYQLELLSSAVDHAESRVLDEEINEAQVQKSKHTIQ